MTHNINLNNLPKQPLFPFVAFNISCKNTKLGGVAYFTYLQ